MKTQGKPVTEQRRDKPAHTPVARTRPPSRKAKPSFEIPTQAGQPASQDWVYRTEPVSIPAPVASRTASPEMKPISQPTPPRSVAVFMVAGFGMFMAGVAAIGITSLTVVGAVGVPVMIARGILRG